MSKNVFEIYLTTSNVKSESWIKFIYKISKINGFFRRWNLVINIENNYVRYYIETRRNLPTTIGELGDFLIKKVENKFTKEKSHLAKPYLLTKNCKTALDTYDNIETKKEKKLKNVKITFYPYKYNNYLSTTYFYLSDSNGEIEKRKVFGNSAIHEFVSMDFNVYTRFFYQKHKERYLDIEKSIEVLDSRKDTAILSANVFPYLQEELYLNYNNYDFAKHTAVVRSKWKRKIKVCKFDGKKII